MQGSYQVKTPGAPSGTVTERATWWAMIVTDLMVRYRELREAVPDNATLVILPEDDEELREHNLRISAGGSRTRVFLSVKRENSDVEVTPYRPQQTRRYEVVC